MVPSYFLGHFLGHFLSLSQLVITGTVDYNHSPQKTRAFLGGSGGVMFYEIFHLSGPLDNFLARKILFAVTNRILTKPNPEGL